MSSQMKFEPAVLDLPHVQVERRPLVQRVRHMGWGFFVFACGCVMMYLIIALVLSFYTPNIRTSGEERWRRAMRFDASQEPVFPKYIDALSANQANCTDCKHSWFSEYVAIPTERLASIDLSDAVRSSGVISDRRTMLISWAIDAEKPGQKGWSFGAWLIAESEPQLAAMRALAIRKPFGFTPARTFDVRTARFFGITIDSNGHATTDGSDADLMRHFQDPARAILLDVCQMLVIDARHSAQRGDGMRAVEDFEAAWGVTEQILENPSLATEVSAAKLRRRIWKDVRTLVTTWPHAFNAEALDRLESIVLAAGEGTMPISLDFARWELEERLEHMFADDGSGDGHALSMPALQSLDASVDVLSGSSDIDRVIAFLAGPLVWAMMPTRQQTKASFEAAITELEAELEQHPADWKPVTPPPPSLLNPGSTIVASSMATMRTELARVTKWIGQRDGARIAIAAERFRRTEGRAPNLIEELVPRFLPSVPRDPTTGAPWNRVDGLLESFDAE